MNTIVLSDMSLLGNNVQDTEAGIKKLHQLQHYGLKTIILSNRPEYCMRIIGARVDEDGNVRYQYRDSCNIKGNGVDVVAFRPGEKILYSIKVQPDYTIFGNGICTFDNEDELIRLGEFIKKSDLDKMVDIFETSGYASLENRIKDRFGDRCFKPGEDIYKFFNPENGVSSPNNRVYGMQCSERDEAQDMAIISKMEENMPNIKGYRLNGKPCFYQRDVNKLVALNKLLDHEDINVDDCLMILSELTDDVLLREYPKQSEVVRGEMCPESTKTLAKVLNEIG